MAERAQSPLRLLAPIALVAFALALAYVVLSSGGGDEAPSKRPAPRAARGGDANARAAPRPAPRPAARTYTVRAGDTLGAIAMKTGVSAERLQELNPRVDPQALVSGQTLKLRE